MKRYLLFLLALISLHAQSQNLEQELESVFDEFQLMGMSVWTTCGDDEQEFHFGLRDNTRNLPMNSESKYRIASISKSFTALGLMKLYDQGLFNLDDNISDYMGYTIINPNHPAVAITFRQLLSHTSSLQDGTGYNNFLNATYGQSPVPSIASVLVPGGNNYTNNMWRLETPGTHFAYSNINYGLIGTLIEKISDQRFDVYMQTEILEPLGISGNYNVSQLPDIDDVAVLYRKISGVWTAQVDNYQGIAPNPPNLASYVPGTNGVYFAPQGGLRATASEVGKLMRFLQTNGATVPGLLSESTIEMMKSIQWNYTGSNGDNYFGLFNRWGLGLHHANTNSDDQICLNENWGSFIGHAGEAYGLVSDAYFASDGEVSFVFMNNGAGLGYQFGQISIWYTVEEQIFNKLCSHFSECLTTAIEEPTSIQFETFPNPASDVLNVRFSEPHPNRTISLINSTGQNIQTVNATETLLELNLKNASPGVYQLIVLEDRKMAISRIIRY
jgi:CubicO group peptidase (beta-lactamase class C family)